MADSKLATGRGPLIGYWVLTGLIVLSQGASGIGDLMGAEGLVKGITDLGYPAYILWILGPWKVLGAIALAVPGKARLKEWAYAGFFFDFTGAFASHLLHGDGADMVVPALVLTAVLVGSYKLRPAGRRLP